MVGDLVPVDAVHEDELRAAFGVGPDAGSLFWLEQLEALHTANTDFLDYLPKFCRDFLGVPVEEAFLYSVDRAGFSLFAMRDGTDDKWREYRFPFQVEVRRCHGFVQTLQAMKAEVDEAEAELAKDRSPKKAHKSK